MFVYNCNACAKLVETRYHCTFCEDFNLCVACYCFCNQNDSHSHKMEKLGFDLDGGGDEAVSQEARELSIQRSIQSLIQACQCRDANCQLRSCEQPPCDWSLHPTDSPRNPCKGSVGRLITIKMTTCQLLPNCGDHKTKIDSLLLNPSDPGHPGRGGSLSLQLMQQGWYTRGKGPPKRPNRSTPGCLVALELCPGWP